MGLEPTADPARGAPPPPRLAECAAALLACAAAVVVLAAPVLGGRAGLAPQVTLDRDPLYRAGRAPRVVPFSDVTPILLDLSRDLTVARRLERGGMPLWNPLSAMGAPLWAEQGGALFPLKLPFYLAPSLWTYDLFLCLRLVAAGVGAYLLARFTGMRHWPAVASGVTFELSGALVEQAAFGTYSASCMLPWVVLGAALIARRRDGRAAAAAAAALGVALSGGHPTMALLACGGFAVAALGHVLAAWRHPAAAAGILAWSAGAGLLGLCLAAPSLLPLLELNAHGASYKFAAAGVVAWQQTLAQSRTTAAPALLAPHVLALLRSEFVLAHAFAPALGAITLVLAVAGVLRGALAVSPAALLALGVVLATAPPGVGWLFASPTTRLILPLYAWLLVALPLTHAAGWMLQDLASGRGAGQLAVAWLLAMVALPSIGWSRDLVWLPLGRVAELAFLTLGGGVRLALPFALVGLVAVLALRPHRRRAVALLLGMLAAAELLVLWQPLVNQPVSRVLSPPVPPAVAFLQQRLASGDGRFLGTLDRGALAQQPWLALAAGRPGAPLSPMLFGLADVGGLSALPIRRYVDYLRLIDPAGSDFVFQGANVARHALLDLATVRYVVEARADDSPAPPHLDGDSRMPLVYADPAVRIYENQAAVPRVRVVHHTIPVGDAAAARRALGAGAAGVTHADERPHATGAVIIEPDAAGAPPPALSGPSGPGDWARLTDASDGDRLRIEASLASAGVVVIADTYYPGWRAWVDGVETPIFPVDLLFRGVVVPAGTHRIELRYSPASFAWGIGLFAIAALGCGGLLVGRPGGRQRSAGRDSSLRSAQSRVSRASHDQRP